MIFKNKNGLIISKKLHNLSYINQRIDTCYDSYKKLYHFESFECDIAFVGFENYKRNTKIYKIKKQKLDKEIRILEHIKERLQNE